MAACVFIVRMNGQTLYSCVIGQDHYSRILSPVLVYGPDAVDSCPQCSSDTPTGRLRMVVCIHGVILMSSFLIMTLG